MRSLAVPEPVPVSFSIFWHASPELLSEGMACLLCAALSRFYPSQILSSDLLARWHPSHRVLKVIHVVRTVDGEPFGDRVPNSQPQTHLCV